MFQRLILALAACFVAHAGEFALHDGETVLFLGDSNTHADYYVQYFDAFLFTRFPGKKFKIVNRGMPSETVAGTSEPSHLPPRPDMHARFSGVVTNVNPHVLIACYGMNDGIYLSPNESTFAKFRAGIQRLVERTGTETSARLILVTPPAFDARPFLNRPLSGTPDYNRPALDYDDALKQFSGWLLSLRGPGRRVVDIHSPIGEHIRQRRASDPTFQLAGDGVHINETGHMIWALELLTVMNAPSEIEVWPIDLAEPEQIRKLPLIMPHDPKWDAESVQLAQFDERLNHLPLVISNPKAKAYAAVLSVSISNLRATVNIAPGTREVNLYPAYVKLIAPRAQEVMRLVQERRRLMLELWVRDDPHPRLAGMHRKSTASQARIDELERQIRDFCQPVTATLRLVSIPANR